MIASSPALASRQRDILGAITALLLLVGVFGVVIHGMPSAKVVHAAPRADLSDLAPAPEVKRDVVTVPTTVPKFKGPTFRAAFPVTPERQTKDYEIEGHKLQLVMYLTDQPDKVFGIAYVALPGDASVDLAQAAQGSANGGGGTLKSTIPTTFQGYRAIEARIAMDGGTMRELIVSTPGYLFMIMTGGEGDPVAEFYDFRDSVELL